MRDALRFCLVTAAGLTAAACGSGTRDDAQPRRSGSDAARTTPAYDDASASRTTPDSVSNTSTDVDLNNVVDVGPDAHPSRTYFYDPDDSTHVYWFESSNPESWTYRPVYGDGGRVYFLDREGGKVRRVYFDDARARQFDWSREPRWTNARREALRTSARESWSRREREESGWRRRWEASHSTDAPPSSDRSTSVAGRSEVDLDAVVDVPASTYQNRTYFSDPGDSSHVYWFDSSNPGSWSYRSFYRDGDRAYLLERNGSILQRVYFDEPRAHRYDWAKESRWSAAERDKMRSTAREEWTRRERDESGWRGRWDEKRRAEGLAGRGTEKSDRRGEVDLDAVVDVPATTYPDRTYFHDPADATHVYWFDSTSPKSWSYRPFYRDGDRTYVLERVGPSVQRIYFDEARAKEFDLNKDSRWSVAERGTMRSAAREEWTQRQRDESGWRSQWAQRGRADETASRGTDRSKPGDETVDLNNVSDVNAETFPNRRYFYDSGDTSHVYWFDTSDAGTWNYRPVYRDGRRAYFLDRDGSNVRRFYFDDARAQSFDWSRESRWDEQQRTKMRDAARQSWSRREKDESGWRSRWDQQHRGERR